MPSHRVLRLAAGLLALAAPLAPAATLAAPEASVPAPPPLPPERPDALRATPVEGPVPTPPPRPADVAPLPAAPAGEAVQLPVPPPTPPERPPELSGDAALKLKVAAPDDTACRARLTRLGVTFEPLPAIADGQCSAPLPLKVTALADGVALAPAATLTCRSAEAVARWVTEVRVEAERTLKRPLTGLEVGGSYVCRGQNHDADAKLSEHAFAGALDVMGFALAGGPPVPVKGVAPGTPEAEFLDAARSKACTFFRTVLGPGSDAAHGNHLHLDERERNAGHRLCQ